VKRTVEVNVRRVNKGKHPQSLLLIGMQHIYQIRISPQSPKSAIKRFVSVGIN